jgi:UrcA family protein
MIARSYDMSRLLKMKFLAACALTGTFLSPLSAVAYAVSALDEPPTRVVGFRDLDLNQDVGVATLFARIRSAAREVCEPLDNWSLRLLRQQFNCREDAIGRAVADVNSPALTAYFLTKSKAAASAVQQR